MFSSDMLVKIFFPAEGFFASAVGVVAHEQGLQLAAFIVYLFFVPDEATAICKAW